MGVIARCIRHFENLIINWVRPMGYLFLQAIVFAPRSSYRATHVLNVVCASPLRVGFKGVGLLHAMDTTYCVYVIVNFDHRDACEEEDNCNRYASNEKGTAFRERMYVLFSQFPSLGLNRVGFCPIFTPNVNVNVLFPSASVRAHCNARRESAPRVRNLISGFEDSTFECSRRQGAVVYVGPRISNGLLTRTYLLRYDVTFTYRALRSAMTVEGINGRGGFVFVVYVCTLGRYDAMFSAAYRVLHASTRVPRNSRVVSIHVGLGGAGKLSDQDKVVKGRYRVTIKDEGEGICRDETQEDPIAMQLLLLTKERKRRRRRHEGGRYRPIRLRCEFVLRVLCFVVVL